MSPTIASCSGNVVMPTPLVGVGILAARGCGRASRPRPPTAAASTPGFSRATTREYQAPRCLRDEVLVVLDRQPRLAPAGYEKPAGITPMTSLRYAVELDAPADRRRDRRRSAAATARATASTTSVLPGVFSSALNVRPERRRDAQHVEQRGADLARRRAAPAPPRRSGSCRSRVIAAAFSSDLRRATTSMKFGPDITARLPFRHVIHADQPVGSGYGSGFSSTPLTTLKIALLAPMPSASVSDGDEREARAP